MRRCTLLLGAVLSGAFAALVALTAGPRTLHAQARPASTGTPIDSWPTYNGDYTGRRFSPLTKINTSNVQALSLAWVYRVNLGAAGGGGVIKATPLQVNVILYFTVPDEPCTAATELWRTDGTAEGTIRLMKVPR